MTIATLPRSVAARITVNGVATTQRVMAATGALVAALIVVDVFVARGFGAQVSLVVAPLLGMSVLALVMLWRPSVWTAVLFIAAGGIFAVVMPVLALAVDPQLDETGPYLLNRVATAVCLVGAVSGRALNGVGWSVAAFVVAQFSLALGLMLSGSESSPGIGPVVAFTVSLATYLTLSVAQRNSDSRLTHLSSAADAVRAADQRRVLEQRAASVLHDTLLSDLAAIALSRGAITDRTRTVLGEHLAVVAASSVADGAGSPSAASALGNALRELARDYQHSGVRVDVSGAEVLTDDRRGADLPGADLPGADLPGTGLPGAGLPIAEHLGVDVPSAVRHAVVGAARAALDNVVKHAGIDRAELVIGMHDRALSVLVVDDGNGFAATEVGADRMGVRMSIEQRIHQVGGTVRIWSGPDGTTVMMTVPLGGGGP